MSKQFYQWGEKWVSKLLYLLVNLQQQFQLQIEDIMDQGQIGDKNNLGLVEEFVKDQFSQNEKQSVVIFVVIDEDQERLSIKVNQKKKTQELKQIILEKYPENFANIDDFDLYYQDSIMDKSKLINYLIKLKALIRVKLNKESLEYKNTNLPCQDQILNIQLQSKDYKQTFDK